MHALLYVAACGFYLRGVVAARIGHGVKAIPPLRGYDSSVIFWWTPRGDPAAPFSARIPTKSQILTLHLFGDGWTTIRFVQFMVVSDSTSEGLRQNFPEVPNLGDVSPASSERLSTSPEPKAASPNDALSPSEHDDDSPDLHDSAPFSPPSVTDLPPADPFSSAIDADSDSDTMTCESDLDIEPTSDLIVGSRLSPASAHKQEQHRRLLKRLSKRQNGPGPRWRIRGLEQTFLSSITWMRRSPDPEFMVKGCVSFLNFSVDADQYVELYLESDIAKLVEGIQTFIGYDNYLVFGYGSQKNIATKAIDIHLSQPCIEREADSLTPEQLKQYAKEMKLAWVNSGSGLILALSRFATGLEVQTSWTQDG